MHLREYLKKKLITPAEFSTLTGIERSTIYGYLKGIPARIGFAYKIEKFTEGEVTADEMMKKVEVK